MNASRPRRVRVGFTLIELLVSMVILALLVVILVSMTNSVGRIWTTSTARAEEFRGAREAFEAIVRKLGETTLNPYLDYVNALGPTGKFRTSANASTFVPITYKRRSELRFISGNAATLTGVTAAGYATSNAGTSLTYLAPPHAIFCQAPLGVVTNTTNYADLENVLNTVGYFIEYGDDSQLRPNFISTQIAALRYRFRLMEMLEPSDSLSVYKYTADPTYSGTDWFTVPFKELADATSPTTVRPVSVLAENIVALIILPQLTPSDIKYLNSQGNSYTTASLAPNYLYDSTGNSMSTVADPNLNPTNQLPPVVQVTMVAVDETSFGRRQPGKTMPDFAAGLFTDPTQYDADLKQLQANLLGRNFISDGVTFTPSHPGQIPLNYRIFTTNVSVKAAKWSSQKN